MFMRHLLCCVPGPYQVMGTLTSGGGERREPRSDTEVTGGHAEDKEKAKRKGRRVGVGGGIPHQARGLVSFEMWPGSRDLGEVRAPGTSGRKAFRAEERAKQELGEREFEQRDQP